MSGKIMGQVWDLDLDHAELLVLLALTDHADHLGNNIYPSVGLVAWKCGYSERQVQRIIKTLVGYGVLIQVGKTKQGVKSYRVDFTDAKKKPDFTEQRQNVTPINEGDKMSPPTRQNVTPRGDIAMSPKPSYEPSVINQSLSTPATQDAVTPPLVEIASSEVVHDSLAVVTLFKPKGLLEIHKPLADMIGIEPTPSSQKKEVKPKNPLFCEPLKGQVAAVVARYAFDVNYESLNSAEQGKLFKSRISPILKSLLVAYQTSPITADELDAAYRWFRKHNKKANYPAGENTVYTMLLGYRQAKAEYENETPTPKLIAKTLPNGTVVYGESE